MFNLLKTKNFSCEIEGNEVVVRDTLRNNLAITRLPLYQSVKRPLRNMFTVYFTDEYNSLIDTYYDGNDPFNGDWGKLGTALLENNPDGFELTLASALATPTEKQLFEITDAECNVIYDCINDEQRDDIRLADISTQIKVLWNLFDYMEDADKLTIAELYRRNETGKVTEWYTAELHRRFVELKSRFGILTEMSGFSEIDLQDLDAIDTAEEAEPVAPAYSAPSYDEPITEPAVEEPAPNPYKAKFDDLFENDVVEETPQDSYQDISYNRPAASDWGLSF